ncbi:MAG: lipopolysaccharide biosynthesis protein [Eubacteriales bacterium]
MSDLIQKKQSLMEGTAVYFVGNVLTQLISLLLLKFITGNIPSEGYGYFNLVVTIDHLITPILTLQISDAVFRFMIKTENEKEKTQYYTVGTVVVFGGATLVCVGVVALSGVLGIRYPGLVATYIISTNLFAYYQKVSRALGKGKYYVLSNLVKAIIYIFGQVVFVIFWKMGVAGLFLANIISTLICVVLLLVTSKSHHYLSFKAFDKNVMGKMVRFSAPLIPNTAVWWMQSSINSIVIASVLGMGANGVYSVANKFSAILNLIINVFAMAWQESAIKEYGTKEYRRFATESFNEYSIVLFSGVALIIPIMKIIMPEMIDPSYYEALIYAPFLLYATALSAFSGFFASIITAKNQTPKLLITNIIGAFTNVLIVFVFIRLIGIWAIVLSAVVSNIMIDLSRYYVVRKDLENGSIRYLAILAALTLGIVNSIVYYVCSNTINVIAFVLSALTFLALNRVLLLDIWKMIKTKIQGRKP